MLYYARTASARSHCVHAGYARTGCDYAGCAYAAYLRHLYTRTCLHSHRAESSLTKLSSLGHFLKGSSAALGIIKVQDSCEKMQHYGNLRDEEAGIDLSEKDALKRIQELLDKCKVDYEEAKEWMEGLYVEEA